MGGDGGCEAVLGAGCGVMWGGCNGRWREWGGRKGLEVRGKGFAWGGGDLGTGLRRGCGVVEAGLRGDGAEVRGSLWGWDGGEGMRVEEGDLWGWGGCGEGAGRALWSRDGVGRGLSGAAAEGKGEAWGLKWWREGLQGGGGSVGVSRGPLWSSEGALWESYGAEPYRATVGPKRCAGDSVGSLWMWGGALWDSGGAGELLEGGGGGGRFL